MKQGDLVYIRWEDSLGCPRGWEPLDDARSARCVEVESVGWVMGTQKRAIQLAAHVAPGCVQGHISIPRSAILAERVIERSA